MTAVVAAAVPVFHSPSSADFSARRFPPNVACHVSFRSTPLSLLSSSRLSALRKSGRRSRRRVAEAREGSSFVYLVSKELAHGHEEFGARQSARNARFRRASVQDEESLSRSRILSADEGKLPWTLHRQQARGVKASAMHYSRGSKFSEFAHTSESHNRDDFIAQNQKETSHKQSRSSPNVQRHNGSFVAKKHPRAPLPTENQQSRLHNEATIFEGITEPRSLGFSKDDALSNVKERGPKLNMEKLEHRQNTRKGTLFMLKLEEELSNFEKKVDLPKQSSTFIEAARRGDSPSFRHAAQGSQDLTSEWKGGELNGVQIYSKGKDTLTARPFDFDNSMEDATITKAKDNNEGQPGEGNCSSVLARKGLQSDLGQAKLSLNKTARGDEAGFTSFNLFSSSPSVPWEADRNYPSAFVPISRNRRALGRHLPTSVGSRSSPSQRSVTIRNKGYPEFGSQVTSGVDDAVKVSRGERNSRSDSLYAMKVEDDRDKTQIDSLKGAVRLTEQERNFVKLESQAASGIIDALESGEREELMEPWSGSKEDIIRQGALKLDQDVVRTQIVSGSPRSVDHAESLGFDWDSDVEDKVDRDYLNAEKAMPLKSSPSAMSLHAIHNHENSVSEDNSTDVFVSFSDSEDNSTDVFMSSSDAKGNAYALAKSDLTVFPDCEDDMRDQSNFRELDDDKVSIVFSDAEDDTPSPSNSGEVDGRNAHDTHQLNASKTSSKNKKHKPPVSANWHKHELPDLPFEFQFSYTETPQRPILRYREAPFSPFGPSDMKRPWTGDRPNNLSKKKPREFDSFHPPPRDLKGVKSVQDPGPYPEGQGPKAAESREEIMGEPLTKEEIVYLVEKCQRETRQLNLGRDGLTHNMLDLIHSHWKRRRVCRIKCKGVPTVDMDNVKFQIEDKTGGKIIFQTGGVLYLFRGRNYNYKDRPCIPLMLWKPAPPVYPKLIQPAPEGLTTEESQRLRQLGRKVEPMCKLGKNGVYSTLVEEVRAAFEVDELVRVDCRGLNPSDYKKIGAKLRDLVPCVLLSFDKDHILMWKGKHETTAEGTGMSQGPDSEAMADNTCNRAEHSDPSIDDISVDEGDKEAFKPPPTAQDPCEVGEVSSSLASPNVLSLQREENKGQVDVLSTSIGLATNKGQVDEDTNSEFNYVVDIDALWEHAFQSGMAIELLEEDMDSDLIVRKADELALSAPLAPNYTIKLMYKLQLKRDPDYKPNEELRIHFGRVLTQRPKKEVKRKFQLPTVGVPGMGGLPVDELAKLLLKK